jgi:hypothetical protein
MQQRFHGASGNRNSFFAMVEFEVFTMRLRLLACTALIFSCWFQCVEEHSAAADEPLRIGGKTMGSYYAIVVDSPGSANAEQLKEEIEAFFWRHQPTDVNVG